jgi:hypothetical protein
MKVFYKFMGQKGTSQALILCAFILFGFIYHSLAFTGLQNLESLYYAELAHDLIHGQFEHINGYSWTIILFTALSYKLIGINDLASALPAMLLYSGILFIVYKQLRDESVVVLITGLALTALSEWFLFYSDQLMPDIYVAFAICSALYFFAQISYDKGRPKFPYAFLMTLSLFFGMFSKETMLLALPLLLYLFITDMLLKRRFVFWLYSLISFLILGVIVFLISLKSGILLNPFAENYYLNSCNYADKNLTVLFTRVSVGLIHLLMHNSMFFGLIFILAFLLHRGRSVLFRFDTLFSFYLISAIILFLSANFMSVSLTEYIPMCLESRHFIFLTPILAIPASRIIYHFTLRRVQGWQIISLLFLAILTSYFYADSRYVEIYIMLFSFFSLKFFVPTTFRRPEHFALVFLLILGLIPLNMIYNAIQTDFHAQRSFLREEVLKKHPQAFIVTNKIQKAQANYYKLFNDNKGPFFLNYEELNWHELTDNEKFILINPYTEKLSDADLPYYAKDILKNRTANVLDENSRMALYSFNHMPEKTLMVSAFNDFESAHENWFGGQSAGGKIVAFNGAKCQEVGEFSSAYVYSLDSTYYTSPTSLLLNLNFQCQFQRKTMPQLIVVLNQYGSEYYRESLVFSNKDAKRNTWFPVSLEIVIPRDKIKQECRLKIFLWNKDKTSFFVDDAEINISKLL